MAEDKNVGGMLVAFLAGSVVGAALALLFAPISGAETRKKIKSASIDTKERALEKVETVKSEASRLAERGKEKVTGVKSQIQAAVEAGKEAYTQKKSEVAEESEE
jgi:gas vesicle protein